MNQMGAIFKVLDGFFLDQQYDTIIHGASKGGGVDTYVRAWAGQVSVEPFPIPYVEEYPVEELEYELYGKAAPRWRNERMVNMSLPDVVVAFSWEGWTPGTKHCYDYARSKGIPGLAIFGGL